MDRGLYIAASGMLAEQVRQDQIANDLANASTPGYKADRATQASFGELMLRHSATGRLVGPTSMAVRIDRVNTDFSPAPIRETGEPLDLAIEGQGFFAVRTPDGVRYTRNGQFAASAQGTLVTSTGLEVLSQDGGPVPVRDGRVAAGAVGVFEVTGARKVGESLVTGVTAGRAAGNVRTGALEASGADPARSMVDMIASFRAFEAGQRVLTTIDDSLQRAANDLGSTR